MKCPDTIEELDEILRIAPLCKVTLYNQAKSKIETGAAKSVSEASRQIGEETGKKPESIGRAIRREQEIVGRTLSDLSGTIKYRPPKLELSQEDKRAVINLCLSCFGARVAGKNLTAGANIAKNATRNFVTLVITNTKKNAQTGIKANDQRAHNILHRDRRFRSRYLIYAPGNQDIFLDIRKKTTKY